MKSAPRFAVLCLLAGLSSRVVFSQDSGSTKEIVSFKSGVAPLLVKNCQPCHFPGGKVFAKLPFEDYLTVKKLGLKLNTRFKEKEQQTLVKAWVKSGSPQ